MTFAELVNRVAVFVFCAEHAKLFSSWKLFASCSTRSNEMSETEREKIVSSGHVHILRLTLPNKMNERPAGM